MIKNIQEQIKILKKETSTAVLAHSYQSEQICEIADYCGDSFALSKLAQQVPQKNILLCGVKFMAETAKILSPEKRVFMPNKNATCPMAEALDYELVEHLKKTEPNRKIVVYINTTAKIKELADVCVTSSAAVKIINAMPEKEIYFLPDCNLGDYVKKQCPEKDIKLIQGGCPVHASVTLEEFNAAKAEHPDALVLIHPECDPKLVEKSDFVGSTTEIMDYALTSDKKEFIIGTEISITEHLQFRDTAKKFYALSKKITCPNMKLTTLIDVFHSLQDFNSAFEIKMTAEEIEKSKKCIDKMLELGR
ncbi:MAG: quinolinate synthase NadA [Oscillospiraceae bacterium]|jgi:quinolinate synthase|nr:quinolinate synthase NadA [Oscillospiraceae bacterium]